MCSIVGCTLHPKEKKEVEAFERCSPKLREIQGESEKEKEDIFLYSSYTYKEDILVKLY